MPPPSDNERALDSERAWFAEYYGEERFNSAGMALRMQRDLRNAVSRSRGGTLGRVLSIGCGDGRFECLLATRASHVVGIDISPDGVEIARQAAASRGIENVEFQACTIGEFDWNGSFDTVFCMALFHHLPEAEVPVLASKIAHHLAPGGMLFSLDPNANAFMRKIGRIVLGSSYHRYHTDDERELDPEETVRTLRDSGFDQVEMIPADWTLIPAMYLFDQAPMWVMWLFERIDRTLLIAPIGRWASGFYLTARGQRSASS